MAARLNNRSAAHACAFLVATSLVEFVMGQTQVGVNVCVYGPLLEPVPNAEVAIRGSDWSLVRRGRTDGSGQFFFTGDEGDWVYCCATAPGMSMGVEFTRPLKRETSPVVVDVRLFAAATIRGTVRDERGQPVLGAEVIHAFDNAPMGMFKGETESVMTDASGSFTLSHVPLGDIAVRASAEGFELGEAAIYLRDDATVDVVMKSGNGRELVIAVEGVPAERLPDIECRMFAMRGFPQPHMALPPRLVRVRLDENGQRVIHGLPREPGLSMIRLEAQGMRFHPQWHEVEPGKDGKATFRLDAITGPRPSPKPARPAVALAKSESEPISSGPLVPTRVESPTLRGVLRDEGGKPRGFTRVRLYSESTGWREAVTAEDGAFAVDAKYDDSDKIAFELRDPDWVLVDKTEEDRLAALGAVWRSYALGKVQELVVTAAAKVHGSVVAPQGESVAGLSVWLETKLGGVPGRHFAGSGATNAKGAFTIDGLRQPKGEVWLVVRSLRGTAEAGPFTFGASHVLEGMKLELLPPLVVTGTVVDGEGLPFPGARVSLATPTRGSMGLGPNQTLSDVNGRFVLRGIEAGKYVVEVRVRGSGVAAKGEPFEVGDEKRVIEQQIKLRRI